MVATTLLTVDEFERMPDDGSGAKYELVRGVMIQYPPGGWHHGMVGATVLFEIGNHVHAHSLGGVFAAKTGFVVFPDQETVLAPDASFARAETMAAIKDPERFGLFAPDFVVEVVDYHDDLAQLRAKMEDYLAAGVRLAWLIEPKRRVVTVYAPGVAPRSCGEGDVLNGGDVLPEFRLAVSDIFAR